MLKIYYTDVSDLPDQTDGLILSDYRKAKIASCRDVRMRKQQIGAELLLLWTLRQEGIRKLPPVISVLPGGKPVLQDIALEFSLSHSGALAACAISDRPVGLDLERKGRYHESLLRRCFSPEEQHTIRESLDPDAVFTELWTGKESMLKLTGTGIRDNLSLVHPLAPDPKLRIWHTRILPGAGDEILPIADRRRYHLSVCFHAAIPEPESLRFVPAGAFLDVFGKTAL